MSLPDGFFHSKCSGFGATVSHATAFRQGVSSETQGTAMLAVLGMMYGPPILVTAAVGFLNLLVGWTVLTLQRLGHSN
jgi:hypothetical protein